MVEKACRNCRMIVEGDACPLCKTSELTDKWGGLLLIIEPEKSELAAKAAIKVPGRYAVRIKK